MTLLIIRQIVLSLYSDYSTSCTY